MSNQNKQFLASYGRAFLAAVTAVWLAKGFSMTDLGDVENIKLLVDAGLAAVLPPLLRALNPKDSAFGFGAKDIINVANTLIDEAAKQVKTAKPVKKAVAKKTAADKRTKVK